MCLFQRNNRIFTVAWILLHTNRNKFLCAQTQEFFFARKQKQIPLCENRSKSLCARVEANSSSTWATIFCFQRSMSSYLLFAAQCKQLSSACFVSSAFNLKFEAFLRILSRMVLSSMKSL